jgi:hypothetical protein
MPVREIVLLYRGNHLNEDLKTLKDLGLKSNKPDGKIDPVKIILYRLNVEN